MASCSGINSRVIVFIIWCHDLFSLKSQTRNVQESVPPRTQDKPKSPASVKSWILQYAEHSSDSEEFTDPDDGVDDPVSELRGHKYSRLMLVSHQSMQLKKVPHSFNFSRLAQIKMCVLK